MENRSISVLMMWLLSEWPRCVSHTSPEMFTVSQGSVLSPDLMNVLSVSWIEIQKASPPDFWTMPR